MIVPPYNFRTILSGVTYIFLCAVLLRTVVTLFTIDYKVSFDINNDYNISVILLNPGEEVDIPSPVYFRTRVTHICSFIIWISGSLIPLSLLVAMRSYMKNIVTLRNVTILSMLGNVLSFIVTVFVVCYEVWMFSYIFVSYALSCAFIIRLVMVMPFFTVISHSIYQAMFLMQYARTEVCPRNVPLEQFLFHLYISGFFNFIMFVHLICMAITAVFIGGISKDWSAEKYVIVPLGCVELLYRAYAFYCYYTLYIIHKPISDPVKSRHVGENVVETETLPSIQTGLAFNHCFITPETLQPDYNVTPYKCNEDTALFFVVGNELNIRQTSVSTLSNGSFSSVKVDYFQISVPCDNENGNKEIVTGKEQVYTEKNATLSN